MFRMPLSRGVFLATLITSAMVFTPASAAVLSIADCNGSLGILGATIGSTNASCSSTDATATVETSFTEMKAIVSVGSDGQIGGDYRARSQIEDSVTATSVDPALLGQQGTLQFVIDIDGVLGGQDSRLFFSAAQQNAQGQFFLDTALGTDITFSNPGGVSGGFLGNQLLRYTNNTAGNITMAGQITATFDVVFGETFTYQISQQAVAQQPNTFVDFFNTASISDVLAFDAVGNRIAADLVTASGVDLPQSPLAVIPIPAAAPLFISALAGMFGWSTISRRRLSRHPR